MSWPRSVFAGCAFLVAVGAVVLAGSDHSQPVANTAGPQVESIAAATLSCPGSPSPGAASPVTSLFAVGPDVTAPVFGPAELTVFGTGVDKPRLGASISTGRPLRVRFGADVSRTGVVVKAVGAQAPGVTAAQLSTYGSARATGSAASWCETPRDQWWFNGVDTRVGTSTTVVLSNPSPAVAVVDLQILGADGVVDAPGAGGIAIGPASRKVLDLARYAPGEAALTLHVTATRGSVAAAVSTTRLDGLTPVGAEWVPASEAPSRRVVVNAAVGDLIQHSLVVTNAGTRQQVVSVRILDSSGAFVSTLLPDLQVPPESVVVTGVGAILKRKSMAIELSAAGPVTGALFSDQLSGRLDFAVTGVSPALTSSAVVPTFRRKSMTLSFATSSPGVQPVEVVGVNGAGEEVGRQTVTVKGLATTTWKPPGWGAAYLVVTVPRGSDLHAVVTYVGTEGITQLPLLSGRRTLIRPAVLPY